MAGTLGVLVAGGAGTRLGLGVPKALVTLGGETLLARAIRTLSEVCDEVAVAAPADLALPLPEAPGANVLRVHDLPDGAGPMAGVLAGLASRPFERALVLAVDLPFVSAAALRGLLAQLGGHQAAIPAPGGVFQPLAAAYAASARALLEAQFEAGERSLRRAIGQLSVLRLDDAALARLPGGVESFFNLNTTSDLAEAGRRVGSGETVR